MINLVQICQHKCKQISTSGERRQSLHLPSCFDRWFYTRLFYISIRSRAPPLLCKSGNPSVHYYLLLLLINTAFAIILKTKTPLLCFYLFIGLSFAYFPALAQTLVIPYLRNLSEKNNPYQEHNKTQCKVKKQSFQEQDSKSR